MRSSKVWSGLLVSGALVLGYALVLSLLETEDPSSVVTTEPPLECLTVTTNASVMFRRLLVAKAFQQRHSATDLAVRLENRADVLCTRKPML
jgi:hypothetical protein